MYVRRKYENFFVIIYAENVPVQMKLNTKTIN